jgi:hypothetical protein
MIKFPLIYLLATKERISVNVYSCKVSSVFVGSMFCAGVQLRISLFWDITLCHWIIRSHYPVMQHYNPKEQNPHFSLSVCLLGTLFNDGFLKLYTIMDE